MATMIKEKRREKKKAKQKSSISQVLEIEDPPIPTRSSLELNADVMTADAASEQQTITTPVVETYSTKSSHEHVKDTTITSHSVENTTESNNQKEVVKTEQLEVQHLKPLRDEHAGKTFEDLNLKLERMSIPALSAVQTLEVEQTLVLPNEYVSNDSTTEIKSQTIEDDIVVPSAPTFEIEEVRQATYTQPVLVKEVPAPLIEYKVQCMPLEQAIWIYGGKEIAEVKSLSEREEAAVETGPVSGPEHPLVDLLSTLRQSYTALERDRTQLFNGFAEEEKYRSTLWKIEKKTLHLSEQCKCGASVDFWGSYEDAQLLKDRIPAARMRLTALLRDIQESYCHHQYSALLAFCQIEEFLSGIIKTNKNEIREALTLILQALKLSDNATLAKVLQRWATALSVALVDGRDLRQLLFLIHHLFRQTRSVRWAAPAVSAAAGAASGPELLALLELLLTKPPALEHAAECTEEGAGGSAAEADAWEEVGRGGAGGAVSEGALRERDLLALLRAAPLRRLVGTIMLFPDIDVRRMRAEDWRAGGNGALRAARGVRALLAALHRARVAHPNYTRLHRALRTLSARALRALAALHLHASTSYERALRDEITAEMEACYMAGVKLFGTSQLQRLPATLLADNSASDYYYTLIIGLHDKDQNQLEVLPITVPLLSCKQRVEVVSQATIDRRHDHQLARVVVEFLLQACVKRKPAACGGAGGCEHAARAWLPRVLHAHPYLYTIALHLLADIYQMSPLEACCVQYLRVQAWRPTFGDARAVLDDWARRCPPLLAPLLLNLDYTPHSGVSLEVQLTIGSWVCARGRSWAGGGGAGEALWRILRRLRVHRACWALPLLAPDPDPEPDPDDHFANAYALLSSSWGHCIPLICSRGAEALARLAGAGAARTADAVHCLAAVLLALSPSPESVSRAHAFTEVFNTLLNSGPKLVLRALGLGGASGAQLLMKLMLAQLADGQCGEYPCGAVLACWLRAAWRPRLAASGAALVDAALLAARDWPAADAHAALLLQECNREQLTAWCRAVSSAPLATECLLRAAHAHELRAHLPRLLDALHRQRAAARRTHVDHALQEINANVAADELVVYRACAAALSSPPQHPAHLMLWRLFMHIYLQRPSCSPNEATAPIGPLFFSGIVKSRMLSNVRKRLQEVITYHQNEAKSLSATCTTPNSEAEAKTLTISKSNETKRVKSSNAIDSDLPPGLTATDFTGEASDESDTDSDEEDLEEDEKTDTDEVQQAVSETVEEDKTNLINYHVCAERMVREYSRWLDEGSQTHAMPHHADLARYMPEQALSAAWQARLRGLRAAAAAGPGPGAGAAGDSQFPLPPPPRARRPPVYTPQLTVFETAVANLLEIKEYSEKSRSRGPTLKSPVGDLTYTDARSLLAYIDKYVNDIEQFAREWCSEVDRITSLDGRLLELVVQLRVPRSLPPQRKACPQNCKPIVLVLDVQEWCRSTGAENSIRENRTSARAAVRRLMRPARVAVRAAVALLALAREIRSAETARRAAERAAAADRATPALHACTPARDALIAHVQHLAQKWLSGDGETVVALVSRWVGGGALQAALVGALLQPRRLPPAQRARVYVALLHAALPDHVAFSHLSKFEMSQWSSEAPAEARRGVLEALLAATTRWGAAFDQQHHMLLELVGVHSSAVVTADEACWYVVAAASEGARGRLPPPHYHHLQRALARLAHHLTADQLGNVARELGGMWWEVRSRAPAAATSQHTQHATQQAAGLAALLRDILRAFVAAARTASYTPERVGTYAWSAAREAWSPWLQPAAGVAALLPALLHHADHDADHTTDHYGDMLTSFVSMLRVLCDDFPDMERDLLGQVWEWSIQTYVSVQGAPAAQECRLQMSALLSALSRLPWQRHQWVTGQHVQAALQVCRSPDREITAWCSATFSGIEADTWLGDVTGGDVTSPSAGVDLARRLAALLSLFTAAPMPYTAQQLEAACRLPWWYLPETTLDEALDNYFIEHYDTNLPYHEIPQFSVLRSACALRGADVWAAGGLRAAAWSRRARCVSRWQSAASSQQLVAHVPAHCAAMLQILDDLAPFVEESSGELEDLFSRAVVIMCVEPAATVALPAWVRWVRECGPGTRALRAAAAAVAALTPPAYCAALADATARTMLARHECGGWEEVRARWQRCTWAAEAAAAHAHLHAAYGLAHALTHRDRARSFLALLALNIDFLENEVIIALWICYACRAVWQSVDEAGVEAAEASAGGGGGGDGGAGGDSVAEAEDCRRAAGTLLSRWAEPPRRTLLRLVSLQSSTDSPTAEHRVLCLLALYILSPGESTARSYNAALSALPAGRGAAAAAAGGAGAAGAAPRRSRLPHLAALLYPRSRTYFDLELQLAVDD